MRCADQIKQKLMQDVELLVSIVERLGCHSVTCTREELRAALPDGDNPTAVQIFLDNVMTVCLWTRSNFEGDIISFVQYLKRLNFAKALQWLCDMCKVEFDYQDKLQSATWNLMKMFKPKHTNEVTHTTLPESILQKYTQRTSTQWLNEGISVETQRKFEVMYDNTSNRIVFPVRDEDGSLISIKGRTTFQNYNDLGIPKYIHYYSLGKNDILFGLDKNKLCAKNVNEITLFEAEKSVMMMDSAGYHNALSIGTKNINEHQVAKILKLQISNVVLAFDKDVSWNDVVKEAGKLRRFVNVYAIYDREGWLQDKQSPIDRGIDVFKKLYESRVKI